jgi:UDP-glucose 4-epimerase
VTCTARGAILDYAGIRSERVRRLQPISMWTEGAAFGSEAFLRLIRDSDPFDLLCHHAAEVTNHRSPDFDPIRALENNVHGLPGVLAAFAKRGGKAVLLTGTSFEPNEGRGGESLPAVSPYGLSKGLTWEVFRYYCERGRVPLGKFVMPNPFGPWEERGFTPYLMSTWKSGKIAQVKTPDYVRDNCHVSLLAEAYVPFANRVAALNRGWISTNPSGYVEAQGAFTARVAREVSSRTKWPCAFELSKQEDFAEPFIRSNKEAAAAAFPHWSESAAWDDFVAFYVRTT